MRNIRHDRPTSAFVLVAVASISMTLANLANDAGAAFPGARGLIAFSRNDEICVVNEDGTSMKNLTNTLTHEIDPAFDPSGGSIAFIRLNSDLTGDVVVMGVDGSTPRVIAVGSYSHPAFSPDGSQLVVARHGTDAGLYRMDIDGTDLTRLTQPVGDIDRAPAWSPDGTKIAFHRSTENGSEIFVIAADGTGETRLTDNTVSDMYPNWAPDGSQIVFERERDVYKMAPDGSGSTRIASGTGSALTRSDPAFSPDGLRIAFVRDGEIWTMMTDGTSQRRVTQRSGGFSDLTPDWQPSFQPRRPVSVRTAGSSTPPPDAGPTDARCLPKSSGPVRASSSVTISYNGRAFKGTVTSSDPRCVDGRSVLLKRKTRSGDKTDGRARTDDRGAWKVRDRNADGRYFARVTKKSSGSGDNELVCKKADSDETIRVIGVQPPS